MSVELREVMLYGVARYLIREPVYYDMHRAIFRVIWDCRLAARVTRFIPDDIDRPESYELAIQFLDYPEISEEIFRQALEAELSIPF